MEKAMREAKRTTSWVDPDEEHEAGVLAFCRALYTHEAFLADFEPFAAEVARAGDRAALAQLLLKLTVPGLPDIYQGDELLSLSLVDPDNRRAVDWARRRALLDGVRKGAAPTEETRKLWVIVRALVLRRSRPEAFDGDYAAVEAAERTVAFLRGGAVLVAAAVRGEGDPVPVPEGRWRDVLHGGEVEGGARRAAGRARAAPARALVTARRARGLLDRVLLTTWRAVLESVDDRIHRDAAQVGFFAMLSFVPLAMLLVAAFGLAFDDGEVRERVVRTVFENVPLSAEDDRERLEATVIDALRGAGRLGLLSVLLLIAAGSGIMGALRHTINEAWDIHDRPPLLRRKALDLALVLGATIVLACSLASP